MNDLDFYGLKNVFEAFDFHDSKGAFRSCDWMIASGDHDLWFEISHKGEVIARCVDGELFLKNRLDASVKKDLIGKIMDWYGDLRLDPEEQRRMLEDSFEVGQRFFVTENGRYFTLVSDCGRSFNIFNVDAFDSDNNFLFKASVNAGRLANDILSGKIVPAADLPKGLDEIIRTCEGMSKNVVKGAFSRDLGER